MRSVNNSTKLYLANYNKILTISSFRSGCLFNPNSAVANPPCSLTNQSQEGSKRVVFPNSKASLENKRAVQEETSKLLLTRPGLRHFFIFVIVNIFLFLHSL